MNVKTTTQLAALFLVALGASTSNAQCKDGVCRLPGSTGSANYSPQPYQIDSDWGVPRYQQQPSYGVTRSQRPEPGCRDCESGSCAIHDTYRAYRPEVGTVCEQCCCRNGACNCGPNCPTHCQPAQDYETGRRPYSSFSAPAPYHDRQPAADRFPMTNRRSLPGQSFRPVSYSPLAQWQTDYEAALQESRRTGLPLLVRASAEWCGHCKRMKQEVWNDTGLNRNISRSFIAVDLNADIPRDRRLLERMQVQTLPTLLVITPDLKITERLEGYRSAEQLNSQLRNYTPRVQLPLRDDSRSVVLR